MKYPDAKERLRAKYRRRYLKSLTDTGESDEVIRRQRLADIETKLRQGVAETIKEKDQ